MISASVLEALGFVGFFFWCWGFFLGFVFFLFLINAKLPEGRTRHLVIESIPK